MSFDDLGLSAELLRAVHAQGYSEPTPIQAQAIPAVLEGRDVMGAAQTGTGKTAGFTLPILHRLYCGPEKIRTRGVRALVLTPTRELAAQVADCMRAYGKHLPLRSAVIFGGVKINPQIAALRRGVDVLVATPGRLLDHLSQGTVDLSKVEVLVLDEADRMLDMGFIRDIRKVIAALPPASERQTLLFSATFSNEIRKLATGLLENPAIVEVAAQNATADRVRQTIHLVEKSRKREFLSQMIGRGDWRQVLVFTRTKHGANKLATQLEKDGLASAAIHGNKSQGARTRALKGFKSGDVRVLVATDIAARGLDISALPHVVNYELPNVPEDYVHRIGRTARAGREGEAISLVDGEEIGYLRDIERLLRQSLPRTAVEDYTPPQSLVDADARTSSGKRATGKPGQRHLERSRNGGKGHGASANGNGRSNSGQGQDSRNGNRRSDDTRSADSRGNGNRSNGARNNGARHGGPRNGGANGGNNGNRRGRDRQHAARAAA